MTGYRYDAFISYARQGTVEPWVQRVFVPNFRRALQEELAQAELFVDSAIPTGTDWPDYLRSALSQSRVMVAVFSRQYFDKSWCRAEIDSMAMRRDYFQAEGSAIAPHPVHAIVVHDCDSGVPAEYDSIQRVNFKKFGVSVYQPSKALLSAIADLASDVAETIRIAPDWSNDFPLSLHPTPRALLPMRRPQM